MKTETKGKEFLEKIVTLSAEEYCKMKGKDLQSYEPVGATIIELEKEYKGIPEGTEVIVGTRMVQTVGQYGVTISYHGTALIQK